MAKSISLHAEDYNAHVRKEYQRKSIGQLALLLGGGVVAAIGAYYLA